jgi:hypothetical protein
MRRTRALLAASAVFAVLLTGCAAETGGPTAAPTTSPSTSESPSIPPLTPSPTPTKSTAAGIPVGDALTEWADRSLPIDSLGGSAPLVRETATIGQGSNTVVEEADIPAGTWVLGIVCVGAESVSSDIDVNGTDYQQSEALPCAPTADEAPMPLKVQINGPVQVRWTIEAQQPAGVVYQIVEGSADN